MSRFGELLGGKKVAPAPAPAPEPTPAPVVEEATAEDEVVVVDLDTMSKRELEAYGRKHGVELDRRHSRTKLVEELKDHLSDS